MKIEYGIRRAMESDLGLNAHFIKGQDIPVRNCWHFSTDGNLVDFLFRDDEDFIAGTNRIYILQKKYKIVILAYSLMGTHVHFVIWGDYNDCLRFIKEYLKLTSMYLSQKYGDRHKLINVEPHHQIIDTDRYLKTAICYTLKNAPEGGLYFIAQDYPWTSAALYFRRKDYWTACNWETLLTDSTTLSSEAICHILKTRFAPKEAFKLVGPMVFPGEFVAVETVEKIFSTVKAFHFFMCITKNSDVESRGGAISRLSIPLPELHQHKQEICLEKFGVATIRKLSTEQRLALAKTLRARYNCSPKQVSKACGLIFAEVKDML